MIQSSNKNQVSPHVLFTPTNQDVVVDQIVVYMTSGAALAVISSSQPGKWIYRFQALSERKHYFPLPFLISHLVIILLTLQYKQVFIITNPSCVQKDNF